MTSQASTSQALTAPQVLALLRNDLGLLAPKIWTQALAGLCVAPMAETMGRLASTIQPANTEAHLLRSCFSSSARSAPSNNSDLEYVDFFLLDLRTSCLLQISTKTDAAVKGRPAGWLANTGSSKRGRTNDVLLRLK